jgi:hypothetical protein
MSPAAFWMVDAAIGFAGALMVMVLGPVLKRALEPRETELER